MFLISSEIYLPLLELCAKGPTESCPQRWQDFCRGLGRGQFNFSIKIPFTGWYNVFCPKLDFKVQIWSICRMGQNCEMGENGENGWK